MSTTFVAVNAPLIAQWLGGQSIPFLYDIFTDVTITAPEVDISKEGYSGGLCAGLALLLQLGGSLVRDSLSTTGALDLRGRVLEVEGVRQKILHAKDTGFTRMIVPMCNLEKLEAEGWKDNNEREYVKRSVKGVRTFVDVMEAAVDGEYAVTFLWWCYLALIHSNVHVRL